MKKTITLLVLLLSTYIIKAQITSFPYSEKFQGTLSLTNGLPQDWSESGLSSDSIWAVDSASSASSTYFTFPAHTLFAFTNDDACNCDKSEDRLVTPVFDFTALSAAQISFDYFTGTTGTDFVEIEVSIDSGATFSIIDTLVKVNAWTNVVIDLSTYTGSGYDKVAISFKYNDDNSWSYGAAIDNIEVGAPPSCAAPDSLTASSLITTTAELNWKENGSAVQWQIQYDTSGFTLGTGIDSIINVKPKTLNNLTSGTFYDFYVRSICGSGDTSSWSMPLTFRTNCDAINTFPYSENFDTIGSTACWSIEILSGTALWALLNGNQNSSVSARSGNFNAYFYSANYNEDAARLITPAMNLTSLTSPRLNFWYTQVAWGADQDTLGVYYRTSQTGTWTYLTSFSSNTINWTNEIVDLPNPSADYYIAFEGYSGYGRGVTLDDIVVEETPIACSVPSQLYIDSLSSSSAGLTWMENGTATQWVIEYDTAGFTAGMGANSVIVNTDTFTTLTGLSPATAYNFYVRAICGPGDTSAYSLLLPFTTPCISNNIFPFSENFDTIGSTACWNLEILSGTALWALLNGNQNSSVSARSGNFNAYFYSANYNGDAARLITPAMDLTSLTSPRLNFWYTQVAWGADQDTLGVYYRTSRTGTWTYLTSYSSSTINWTNELIDLPNPSTDYYIAFEGYSGYGRGVTLDDIVIEETPNCLAPTTLSISSLTADSLNLSWLENGTATQWIIEWDTTGFTAGLGTNSIIVNTDTFKVITGLSPQSTYDFYVRAICGAGDTSAYSGIISATTLCVPLTTPFFESFDNSALPSCWSQSSTSGGPWVFGTPGFAWNTTGCTGSTPSDHTGNSGNYAAMDHSTTDIGVILEMPTVDVSALTTPLLEFYFTMCGSGYTPLNLLHIEAYNGSGWDSVSVIQQGTNGWELFEFDISGFTFSSNFVRIRFRAESGGSSVDFYGDNAIDDVSIDETPICLNTSVLITNNITSASADLAWTENGTAAEWEISYGITGFTAGNGTQITVMNNPFNLSGLTPDTDYDWYVRAICGAGDSSIWSDTASFKSLVVPTPNYSIGTINTEDVNGLADSLNVECIISGTVTGVNRSAAGYEFALIDQSNGFQEGITVFNTNTLSYYTAPTEGDSLLIWGVVGQANGLTQFIPDSISTLLSSIGAVPVADVSNVLDENTESILIELMDEFVLLDPSSTGSYTMRAVNGTDTVIISVDATTDVDDSLSILTNTLVIGDTICSLVGIGSQFDSSSPYTEGYLIVPSRYADIAVCRLSVGINEVEIIPSNFSIAPNPTSGEFVIKSSSLKNETVRIQIRDISGRVISNENYRNSNQEFRKIMNLNENAKGVYFISIYDGDQVINKKMILK